MIHIYKMESKILILAYLFCQINLIFGNYIDLTYEMNRATPLFPGVESSFNVEIEDITPGGFWVASKGFCVSEHTGTHIDAPFNLNKDERKLDQIPLEQLINITGVMIDINHKVHAFENGSMNIQENYLLTREDIMEWEETNGEIPENSVVLLRTGWSSRYWDRKSYLGFKNDADLEKPQDDGEKGVDWNYNANFPGYSKEAAEYLANEKLIYGAGIDTISIDSGNSKELYAHRTFLGKGKYLLENLSNLHKIPPTGFRLWIFPFKVDRATGAPTRVLAKI